MVITSPNTFYGAENALDYRTLCKVLYIVIPLNQEQRVSHVFPKSLMKMTFKNNSIQHKCKFIMLFNQKIEQEFFFSTIQRILFTIEFIQF